MYEHGVEIPDDEDETHERALAYERHLAHEAAMDLRRKKASERPDLPPRPSYAAVVRTAQNTNAMEPAAFFADIAKDHASLTENAYKQGDPSDFEHFCGKGCTRGPGCHNVGPPGLSTSLAKYGYCKFCVNEKRAELGAAEEQQVKKDSLHGRFTFSFSSPLFFFFF